jgi:mannose-6-phosphate isomerase-like protein (cupin superfamily)
MEQAKVVVLPPGQGAALLSPSGMDQTLKAGAADTGNVYSLWESISLPGEGPGPHIHHNHEEAFYVLDGALVMSMGDQSITAAAGAFLLIPRGSVHAFTNATSTPARLLTIMSPPMDAYRAALTRLLHAIPAGPGRHIQSLDPGELAAIAAEHGVNDEILA